MRRKKIYTRKIVYFQNIPKKQKEIMFIDNLFKRFKTNFKD